MSKCVNRPGPDAQNTITTTYRRITTAGSQLFTEISG